MEVVSIARQASHAMIRQASPTDRDDSIRPSRETMYMNRGKKPKSSKRTETRLPGVASTIAIRNFQY